MNLLYFLLLLLETPHVLYLYKQGISLSLSTVHNQSSSLTRLKCNSSLLLSLPRGKFQQPRRNAFSNIFVCFNFLLTVKKGLKKLLAQLLYHHPLSPKLVVH